MSLPIKDGAGTDTAVRTTLNGTDHVTHHHIDSMPATADSTGTPDIPAKSVLVSGSNPSADNVPLQVDSSGYLLCTTVATITGGATETKQDAIIADTAAIQTSAAACAVDLAANEVLLTTIAGAVTGTEMQVDVKEVDLPAAVYHGKTTVTTAGTEVTLASSQAIKSGVTIKALSGNTGLIFVGANPVTSATGLELNAKESVFLEVANLTTVYIDSAEDGEGVTYIAT